MHNRTTWYLISTGTSSLVLYNVLRALHSPQLYKYDGVAYVVPGTGVLVPRKSGNSAYHTTIFYPIRGYRYLIVFNNRSDTYHKLEVREDFEAAFRLLEPTGTTYNCVSYFPFSHVW
jgi:hypothetical protein